MALSTVLRIALLLAVFAVLVEVGYGRHRKRAHVIHVSRHGHHHHHHKKHHHGHHGHHGHHKHHHCKNHHSKHNHCHKVHHYIHEDSVENFVYPPGEVIIREENSCNSGNQPIYLNQRCKSGPVIIGQPGYQQPYPVYPQQYPAFQPPPIVYGGESSDSSEEVNVITSGYGYDGSNSNSYGNMYSQPNVHYLSPKSY